MDNVTFAVFGGRRVCDTKPLYQYDYGQILQFKGLTLPDAYEVHFGNSLDSGNTTTSIGDADGVEIPDTYMRTGNDVYAFLFLHTGEDDGETVYRVRIPVIKRPQPTNVTPTPVQQDVITQAIAALNSGVDRAEAAAKAAEESADGIQDAIDAALQEAKDSGEFDGKDGVDGKDGKDGADGKDGKDGAPGQDGKDGADGKDGKDGQDGQDGRPGADPFAFTVTLPSANWSAGVQTISNANFLTGDYCYMVYASPSSTYAWQDADVYADDVVTAGQMVFHSDATPSVDLVANVIRLVVDT